MKALILAAGFGTRLQPYTHYMPKALFPIAGQPLLDRHIRQLQQSGCQAVAVNTHHLAESVEHYLEDQSYDISVLTSHEPDILGTGGAIKKLSNFWDDAPFMVVNSDILCDIDLTDVYRFHTQHEDPVTLVLHDYPRFNQVQITPGQRVAKFLPSAPKDNDPNKTILAFTGIHVIDPAVLELIAPDGFVDIIDVYREMIARDQGIRAYVAQKHYWRDIGTPESYREAVFEHMAPKAFKNAFDDKVEGQIARIKLQGDGSERTWYRLGAGTRSLILGDHGLHAQDGVDEVDAFIAIGQHLFLMGLPVPEIYAHDAFSGQVFLQDFGDTHLQAYIQNLPDSADLIDSYEKVIDLLIKMWLRGGDNFDPAWTYQTAEYDIDLVMEKECRYFVEAFLQGYLEWDTDFKAYRKEFNNLAHSAVRFGLKGFLHRDFQSRNIMVTGTGFGVIDFQGGRIGPLQYDLAALLIDPYVSLPLQVQTKLLDYAHQQLTGKQKIDSRRFIEGYRYCAVTRNLQMLGAFGFLSRVKQKHYFEEYIPQAVKNLKHNIRQLDSKQYPKLSKLVEKIPIKSKGGI